MVFPDLSVPQTTSFSKNSASKPALASVADRFLAFVLDFLVFSPFIGLLLAGFARQAKIQFLVKGSYDEALGSMILMGAVVVSLSIALQTIFLFYLNATPGQLFAKLRVVSYPGNSSDRADRLSLNQCLVRSILWWASGMALFLPFLEILSHPLRRTFYERASDTLTVTLKTIGDTGPHPIESRFIASWMRMSFLLLLGFALLGGFKAYRSVMAGGSRDGDRKVASASSSCDEKVDLAAYKGAEVLDISLTLYMADAITGNCLLEKAEDVLWQTASKEEEDLAYLAKYLATEGDKKQSEYFQAVCENPDADACHLAKYMSEEGSLENLKSARADLMLSRFLLADELFLSKDYSLSLNLLNQLQKVSALKGALEKKYVRSIWGLNEQLRSSSRAPASTRSRELLDAFKEKYELP